MDFLESLDLHTTDRKSHRVRSWYLYEQYKSLEKNQLDATKRLKDKSYQEKILHRELNERRARRQFGEHCDLRRSHSRIERSTKSDTPRTPFNESIDSFIESVCEREDLVTGKKNEDNISRHSDTVKSYEDFKSSEDNIYVNHSPESITSVVENEDINRNIGDDIKEELDFVKKNIAEIINMQLEAEKECLENYTDLCDDKVTDIRSLHSIKDPDLKSATVDKYFSKCENVAPFGIWSKLVSFSHNMMQYNRGNCYFDYSAQVLTAVLAFDALCRGINRMCHILQPYVSPIKFANDDALASEDTYENCLCPSTNKSHKREEYKTIKLKELPNSFEMRHRSEDMWHSCKCSYENRINEMRNYGASEPCRSVAKLSSGKNCSMEKSFKKHPELNTFQKSKSSNCKCAHLKKAVNPILKLSQYIEMILQEIED